MKATKLLASILIICLIFICTSCDILKTIAPSTEEPGSSITTPPVNNNTGNNNTGNNNTGNNNTGNNNTGNNNNNGNNDAASFINVIMLNDNHGILNEKDGGMDKIAAGINSYAELGDVVKIANGDMFQGTYVSSTLRGLPMLDALNALDFDAFVIGNHEFDWGLEEIQKYKDGDPANGEAEFPFLGANIYDKRTGEMVDWLEAYTVVEVDEIKIGIIGIIGELESSILASHMENYDFVDAREIVKELAYELRTDKACDVVLVAAHAESYTLNTTLAEYTGSYKIDGIFNGHTHYPVDDEYTREDGSVVCILQNGGYGQSFASLTLEFDESGKLTDTEGKLNYTDNYTSDNTLSSVFEKYEEYMEIGDTVLITVDQDIDRYDIGIQVAHSMFLKYNTDFAVINSGGVRTSIEAGEVTYAEAFQILPFENEVYIVTLSGEMLRAYLLNNTSGIYYWGIFLDTIIDSEYYDVAIVDYVYLGYTFEAYRNDTCIDTNDLIRDVFIEYMLANA